MRHVVIIGLASLCMLAGCSKKESDVKEPAKVDVPLKKSVNVGDSYADVIEKLGKPNIETVTKSSRVLIYDEMELVLQSNAVKTVYDYTGK